MPDTLAQFWPFIGAALGGYLLGSIPFAQILAALAGLGDLREVGSGNVGATNVLRAGHRGMAAVTLLLDCAKGALAVLAVAPLGQDASLIAGAGAVIGHIFPLWLRFQGGKGVATTIGVLLAISLPAGLLVIGTWLVVTLVARMSSLSAITAMASAPAYAWWLGDPERAALALILGILVIAMHRANILRILAGDEPRIILGRRGTEGDGPAD